MNSKILNDTPHVEIFDNFLSKEEIERIELDQLKFHKSLGFKFESKSSEQVDHRTSWTYHTTNFGDKFSFVLRRAFNLIKNHLPHVTLECLESMQITKYQPGEYYKDHWDFFNIPPDNLNTVKNDRCATFIIYFNDDFDQGTTYFPNLNLHVFPKIGSALFFRYNYSDEKIKFDTLHSGQPVLNGTKYIGTIWIRNLNFKQNNH
jgi:prolyl 4-hydroxylase